jgi:HD-like signal output (HDOD) protein
MWQSLLDHLPRLPLWLQQLTGVLTAGTIDLTLATELIDHDPGFRAEFVRICRLAELLSSDDRIENFVLFLGQDSLRTVAAGAFLTNFLGSQQSPLLHEFRRRSEQLASMTYRLALSSNEVDGLEAYVAGLVHHVGTLPLLRTVDSRSEFVFSWFDFDHQSITEQWLRFGTDAIELGQAIALLWDYPTALKQSLRSVADLTEDPGNEPLSRVVRIAEQLRAAGLSLTDAYDNIPSVLEGVPHSSISGSA